MPEMLVVIGLVAFVGLVSMQLFRATLRVWKQSADEQAAQSRFDQAVGQLRRDVWSATSFQTPDAHTLEIHDAAGTVHWEPNSTEGLSRKSDHPGDDRRWPSLGNLSFEASGPTLIVRLEPTHEEAGGRMVLVSQSMLLAGRSR
jgi:type II secretory pathway pseudopilin PulG